MLKLQTKNKPVTLHVGRFVYGVVFHPEFTTEFI